MAAPLACSGVWGASDPEEPSDPPLLRPEPFRPRLLELPPSFLALPDTRAKHVLYKVAAYQRRVHELTGAFALPLTPAQANSLAPGVEYAREPRRYAALELIARLSLSGLAGGGFVSVRSLYYSCAPLLGSQAFTDSVLAAFCRNFELTREELRFRASSKGLLSGRAVFLGPEGPVLSVAGRALIPHAVLSATAARTPARHVLVVEKETIFGRLEEARGALEAALGEVLLVTGKGYPDVLTRVAVALLGRGGACVWGLADGDADGARILCTYALGSERCGPALPDGTPLACPALRPLGLWPQACLGLAGGEPLGPRELGALRRTAARLRAAGEPWGGWASALDAMAAHGRRHELECLLEGGGLPRYVLWALAAAQNSGGCGCS